MHKAQSRLLCPGEKLGPEKEKEDERERDEEQGGAGGGDVDSVDDLCKLVVDEGRGTYHPRGVCASIGAIDALLCLHPLCDDRVPNSSSTFESRCRFVH